MESGDLPAESLHRVETDPIFTDFGSPTDLSFTSNIFDPSPTTGNEEGNDGSKRRRIARACDMCRKKKIKCDGKAPKCSHCLNYKTECIFTTVEKKRSPPKGAKYIEGLENRLGRMEALLRMSGLLPKVDDGKTDLAVLERQLHEAHSAESEENQVSIGASASDTGVDAQINTYSQSSQSPEIAQEEEVEVLSENMCSLLTNRCGESKYIGASSSLSIFSPKGIQWVNEKTGDRSFEEKIKNATESEGRWNTYPPEIWGPVFQERCGNPLPPKAEARIYVNDFFEGFNVLFPLYHRGTFDKFFEKQYSENPPESAAWYASFNIALALACRLRMARIPEEVVALENEGPAWRYFQNASSVVLELLLKHTDLMAVQALLGISLFLQGTANPQPSYVLIAAAIRIAHGIGLHQRMEGFGLSSLEMEQRRRVFWIAYMLDKDLCLRTGRPPAINDDDIRLELPDEDPEDDVGNVPLKDGKGKVNLFRLMAAFAQIESKVYMQLYSAKASKQSDSELLNTIGELDRELEQWKDSVPLEFRPEHDISGVHNQVLHVILLHFAYYNCLTTIHRMSVHHGYWSNRLANYAIAGLSARPLNPRVYSSAALCVQAARASIHLIKYINQKDYPCVWLVIYYPVSALVTLFANIVQNPQDVRARSDLRLMGLVVEFLATLSNVDEGVQRMVGVVQEFERIANIVVERAERDSLSRRKRRAEEFKKAPASMSQKKVTDLPGQVALPASDFEMSSFMDLQKLDGVGEEMSIGFRPDQSIGALQSPDPAALGSIDFDGLTSQDMSLGPDGVILPSFQQPFVPQDLWSLPMTFEWDWADLSTGTQLPWSPNFGQDRQ